MKKVVIESPYAGDVERNIKYAKLCLKDSLLRGEAPIASHLLYTQVLDDTIPAERKMGIEAGFTWNFQAEKVIVCVDLGISPGMKLGIEFAKKMKIPIEHRSVTGWEEK